MKLTVGWWKWAEEVKWIWESWNLDFETQPSTTLDQNSFPKFHQNLFIPSKPLKTSKFQSNLIFQTPQATTSTSPSSFNVQWRWRRHCRCRSDGLDWAARSAWASPAPWRERQPGAWIWPISSVGSWWSSIGLSSLHSSSSSSSPWVHADPDSIHADPLMVETHGSTPPQIRIRAKEEKEALQQGWSLAED